MKKNVLVAFGLILLLSFSALYLRIYMLSLPELDKLAKSEVYNENYDKFANRISEKYPDLPQGNKNKLVKQAYKTYLIQNKYLVDEQVKERAKEKKAFYKNNNGYTYILGIDSYYWLRLIDNLINKGHIGDSIVDGQDYDELVDMPIEKSLSRSPHLILGKLIYKFFSYFKLYVDYEIGLYLIPLLFSVLLVVFTFFVAQMLCRSNIAAFFASLAVNFCPLLLRRTMGEWLDTDIYNVFFPLIIFGSFLYVFKSSNNKKRAIGIIIFALSCSIYASIWQGWWHIFDLLVLCGLVFIFNEYTSEGKDRILFNKNILSLFLLFFLGIIFVGLFNGKESFFSFISEPYKLLFVLKDVPQDNWPNVFLTVAELNKVSPYVIVIELGGLFVFFVTIIGSIYLVLVKKIIRDKELGIGFFCLFIWLSVLYYTSLNAVRLALLLVVPLGIMFGIVIDRIIRGVFTYSLKFPRKKHLSILALLIAGIYLIVSSYFAKAMEIASVKFPMMNDVWYKSLVFIKEDSDEDAIINSWWDFGHWFKAIAKRKVLFDGKTQNSPIAFWIAKVLNTDDEREAVGILRMLDISKNKAFDLLDSYGLTHSKVINILLETVKLPETEARDYLKEFLSQEEIEVLIPLLFKSDMPRAYFIASYDMVSKMRSISHIGSWDFEKGDMWINLSKKRPEEFINYLQDEFGYSEEEAISQYRELKLLNDREAPQWISKIDAIDVESLADKFKKEEDLLIFDNGLVVDLLKHNAYIIKRQGVEIGIPYSVVYVEEGVLKEEFSEDSNLDYSVLIFKKDEDSYGSIFLDKDLTKSMFARMYFLEGSGLEFFEKLHQEKTPNGNSVFVFKIKWPD